MDEMISPPKTVIAEAFIVSDSTCHYAWQDPGDPGMWVVTWAPKAQRFDRNQAITAVTLAEVAEKIRRTSPDDGRLASQHEEWPLFRDLSYELSAGAVTDNFTDALAALPKVKCAGTTAGAPACSRDAVVTIYDSTGEPARVCAEHGTELLKNVIGTWVNWASFTGNEPDRSALRITEDRARIDDGGSRPGDLGSRLQEAAERDNARLPSRDQILDNVQARIVAAREQLNEARAWLRSDHSPVGSDITDEQARRTEELRGVINQAIEAIDQGRM